MLSSATGPPEWAFVCQGRVGSGAEPKNTSSWHDAHAACVGLVFQRSPCGVGVVCGVFAEPSWQRVQLRTSCVKVTAE